MELRIDMERSLTDSEYAELGPPDRKTETILRQELRDEVLIRSVTVSIRVDEQVVWLGGLHPDYVPENSEGTPLPDPR